MKDESADKPATRPQADGSDNKRQENFKQEKDLSAFFRPVESAQDNKLLEANKAAEGQHFTMSDLEDPKQAGDKPPANKLTIVDNSQNAGDSTLKIDANVSPERQKQVEKWWHQIPPFIREALDRNGLSCHVIKNIDNLTTMGKEAEQSARGHNLKVGELPMFYSTSQKALIIVDKPNLTDYEKILKGKIDHTKEVLEAKNVHDYSTPVDVKSFTFAGLERNGWHELGHAIDQGLLDKFSSKSKAFKDAMAKAEGSLATNKQAAAALQYFTSNPDEMFAEIFAIEKAPLSTRTQRDKLILDYFGEVVKIMKTSAKIGQHPIF